MAALCLGPHSAISSVTSKTAFQQKNGEPTGAFVRVLPEQSGLIHDNRYDDPRMWGNRYLAATSGATGTGIAVGDFDGDGRPDLFAAFREGQNRLYRNEGDLTFRDVTEEAGILPSLDWTTGVTAVDIEGDGDLDLYVCSYNAPNQLFLNRGNGRFDELALEWGLDVWDASNAAFFADYDRDGDLDLYLQTNQLEEENQGQGRPDYLFRNDGPQGFTDVTRSAGIESGDPGNTLGHSALWFDFNDDGWLDLYVANDFERPDFLYLNRGDGTFENRADQLPLVPYSSMGSDCGDVNNDGRIDFLVADMATLPYAKHAVSMLPSSVKILTLPQTQRPPQTMKNALYLGREVGDFVEVAYAWNIAATEWTWAVRLQDFDNDGWQDAFFTNGMLRQFHNADLSYQQDQLQSKVAKDAVFPRSPVLNEENLIFRNRNGQRFEQANQSWGLRHTGVSFGAAACDFDQDGDLDLVYSNFNEPLTLWENRLHSGQAVQLELAGQGSNPRAIGARVVARFGDQTQTQLLLANRGYQSSEDTVIHFGIGAATQVDSLQIHWPDGSVQTQTALEAGFRYTIEQNPEASRPSPTPPKSRYRLVSTSQIDPPKIDDAPAPLHPIRPALGTDKPIRLAFDFNEDGRTDLLEGGLGRNNEFVFRGGSSPELNLRVGTFRGRGKPITLAAINWDGVSRIVPGMIDLATYSPSLPGVLGSFEKSGNLEASQFMRITGFKTESEITISEFETMLSLKQADGTYRKAPLPQEFQYGRLLDIDRGEVNRDGKADLIALFGYLSPHFRSPQPDPSFLSVFLGDGTGQFVPDSQTIADQPIGHDTYEIDLEDSRLTIHSLDGTTRTYELNE